jgi:hypothetical protein
LLPQGFALKDNSFSSMGAKMGADQESKESLLHNKDKRPTEVV